MPSIEMTKIRPGTRVAMNGDPDLVTQYQHVKPGKGGAFVRLKLKNLISGAVLDRTLKGGESMELADVSSSQMQLLYREGDKLVFMDQTSYEQVEVPEDLVEGADLLADNCEVEVLLYQSRPVGVTLPNFVELEVTETDPPEKGGKLKPATLETGAQIQVPSFIDRGARLRIDTRDRKYVERA